MIDDAILTEVAERFGTPTYVYDLGAIGERVEALQHACPTVQLRFAVKANPSGAVLRHLAAMGVGAEAITAGEVYRALRAGMPAKTILIGGPGQGPEVRALARDVDVGLVSLDGVGQWHAWKHALPATTRFLVRVLPNFDPRTHPHLATGAVGSKFGMAVDEARALATDVAKSGRLAGFHVHAGSMIDDLAVHERVLDILDDLLADVPGTDVLDLGGGFAVPDFDVNALAALVGPWTERRGLSLVLEPGRFLVADAGTLLTRVLWKKGRDPVHWICDAGMAQLVRPALYDAVHPIRVVDGGHLDGSRPSQASVVGEVQGPLCENADRLGRARSLDAQPGDLLAVERAGAYGLGMASNYASDLRPAEVVIAGGRPTLVRRRETVEDLVAMEVGA